MKISSETVEILKNFAAINSNILVKPGSVLTTMAPTKSIVARATVTEDFTTEFGIYDLAKLLGVISLFDKPDFQFNEAFLSLQQGNRSMRYFYSPADLLSSPKKMIKMPDTPVKFALTDSNLRELLQAANVLQLPDLQVERDEDKVKLTVLDLGKTGADDQSNTCSVIVAGDSPEAATAKYKYQFKVDNLRVLPGTYNVAIAEAQIAEFKHETRDLVYWIALGASSTFSR